MMDTISSSINNYHLSLIIKLFLQSKLDLRANVSYVNLYTFFKFTKLRVE